MAFGNRQNNFQVIVLLIAATYVAFVIAAPGGQKHGIKCYSCDSHVDPDCSSQEHMDKQMIMNCSDFITDLLPTQLRCVRIVSSLADPRGEVVIRRCAVVGDCKYIAKNEKQSCHECAHDLCNDGK